MEKILAALSLIQATHHHNRRSSAGFSSRFVQKDGSYILSPSARLERLLDRDSWTKVRPRNNRLPGKIFYREFGFRNNSTTILGKQVRGLWKKSGFDSAWILTEPRSKACEYNLII